MLIVQQQTGSIFNTFGDAYHQVLEFSFALLVVHRRPEVPRYPAVYPMLYLSLIMPFNLSVIFVRKPLEGALSLSARISS